ncbi:phosphonate transport system permease protein [Alkalispirochaeta americana]|uniref:Phosphonate transport system permease protein n=1 Tax=Alkalispirochaeta americana TaxID=159291 RepID=A0A1N6N9R1_9SPIO|nr:phosphonate ABC transporter, permease protein PhnE [Alkalispirochaeta americana]SIP88799.1 phosphonate transport system permease protein [Alkalispirochaeta americana]
MIETSSPDLYGRSIVRRLTPLWCFLALTVLFLLSIAGMNLNFARIVAGVDRLGIMLGQMFPPDFSILGRIMDPAIETLFVAILGTFIGIILSLLIGVLAAHNITPHPAVEVLLKGFSAFARAVPALIWALLFIVAVGLGPLPGILALAVNSIGMLGKVFAESIEEIDQGQIEAVAATGATPVQIVFKSVIPSVTPALVAWSLFRLDINIRYSAVLGVVGAGGIGLELVRSTRMLAFNETLTITLVIFLMVWAVEFVNNQIRNFVR